MSSIDEQCWCEAHEAARPTSSVDALACTNCGRTDWTRAESAMKCDRCPDVRELRNHILIERMARIDAETKLALAVEKQKARRARLQERIAAMQTELNAARAKAAYRDTFAKIAKRSTESMIEWRERALAAEARRQ